MLAEVGGGEAADEAVDAETAHCFVAWAEAGQGGATHEEAPALDDGVVGFAEQEEWKARLGHAEPSFHNCCGRRVERAEVLVPLVCGHEDRYEVARELLCKTYIFWHEREGNSKLRAEQTRPVMGGGRVLYSSEWEEQMATSDSDAKKSVRK